MIKSLSSARFAFDDMLKAVEFYHQKGWTDGLPVIPPTEEKVPEFLDYVGMELDQVVGKVPTRARVITAEKIAINAVMAGCLAAYMPVLIVAVEAMTAPEFSFHHLASLASPWPLLIVNGPIVKELHFNSGMNLFGPG